MHFRKTTLKTVNIFVFNLCLSAGVSAKETDCSNPQILDMVLSNAINTCGGSLNYMWTTIDKNVRRDVSNDAKNSIGCIANLTTDGRADSVRYAILYRLDHKKIVLLSKNDIRGCEPL